MKKMLAIVFSMILAAGLVSVAQAKMKAPKADAQQLYEYITK